MSKRRLAKLFQISNGRIKVQGKTPNTFPLFQFKHKAFLGYIFKYYNSPRTPRKNLSLLSKCETNFTRHKLLTGTNLKEYRGVKIQLHLWNIEFKQNNLFSIEYSVLEIRKRSIHQII